MPDDKNPQRHCLSLPDADDNSMNHVLVIDYAVFLSTSLSNSVLMTGGLAYLVLSLWDYWIFIQQKHTTSHYHYHWYYNALSLTAPLIYPVNSVLDILWAAANKNNAHISHNNKITRDDMKTTTTTNWWHIVVSKPVDAAHGQITVLASALTFWIAASLAMVAAVLRHNSVAANASNVVFTTKKNGLLQLIPLDMASDHVYILSAVIAIITGKQQQQQQQPTWLLTTMTTTSMIRGNNNHNKRMSFYNDPEWIKNVGDWLYLIGTLWDGSMWYFSYGKEPKWSLFSSILWVLDACLYVRSSNLLSSCGSNPPPNDEKCTKML